MTPSSKNAIAAGFVEGPAAVAFRRLKADDHWNIQHHPWVSCHETRSRSDAMGKGILLWLLGVPIPIILLLWLFFH
jgi:hypothetical protein